MCERRRRPPSLSWTFNKPLHILMWCCAAGRSPGLRCWSAIFNRRWLSSSISSALRFLQAPNSMWADTTSKPTFLPSPTSQQSWEHRKPSKTEAVVPMRSLWFCLFTQPVWLVIPQMLQTHSIMYTSVVWWKLEHTVLYGRHKNPPFEKQHENITWLLMLIKQLLSPHCVLLFCVSSQFVK